MILEATHEGGGIFKVYPPPDEQMAKRIAELIVNHGESLEGLHDDGEFEQLETRIEELESEIGDLENKIDAAKEALE